MLNEKQTDSFYWKNKLEELDCLPGESSNKDALWDKLHDRLREKPRSNKSVWYWAAACLLPVLLMLWMASNKKDPAIVKIDNRLKQNKTVPASRLPFPRKEAIVISPLVSVERNLSIKNAGRKTRRISSDKNNHTKNEATVITGTNTIIETIPGAIVNTDPSPDTAAAVASIVVTKKKLRVVHINELETLPEQLTTTHTPEKSNFKFIFGNGGKNSPAATALQEYTGFAKLKIPLTN